jgi:hypothetical protein
LAKMLQLCGRTSFAEVNKAIRWNAVWEKNREQRECMDATECGKQAFAYLRSGAERRGACW